MAQVHAYREHADATMVCCEEEIQPHKTKYGMLSAHQNGHCNRVPLRPISYLFKLLRHCLCDRGILGL